MGHYSKRLEDQNKIMVNQKKQMEYQNKIMVNQNKHMEDHSKQLEDQKQIMANQKKQVEDYSKQLEDQNKIMVNQKKQMEDQSMLIENCKKKMENYSKQLEDQNILIKIQNMEMENLKNQTSCKNQENEYLNKQLERKMDNQREKQKDVERKLLQSSNIMMIPNIDVDPNFASVSTAFQWKVDVISEEALISPPFYNIKNGMCFQLGTILVENLFTIGLLRYRGKYDHPTNEISTIKPFKLVVHMFGNDGNFKVVKLSNAPGLHIAQSKLISEWNDSISDEISKFTIDGYAHMHLFFNDR